MKDLMFPDFPVDDLYELNDKELEIVLKSKRKGKHKLALAVLIKYFQVKGRFPSQKDLFLPDLVGCLATQLGTSIEDFIDYDWSGTTNKRLRKQVRELFSFREARSEDIASFKKWIEEELVPKGYTFEQDLEKAYEYLKERRIEPFSEKKMERHINSAYHAFEKEFFRAVFEKMSPVIKSRLDDLLKEDDDEKGSRKKRQMTFRLNDLKKNVKGTKLNQIEYELKKLNALRGVTFECESFSKSPRKFLNKYYLRIMVKTPSRLKEYSPENRYGQLALFCYLQSQEVTDGLMDLFIKSIKRIKKTSETHVSKKAMKEIRPIGGKFDILHKLASLSAEHPHGVIKDTIYPKVSKEVLLNLAKELEFRGGWYRQKVQTKMNSVYSYAHRKFLFPLLEALEFRTSLRSEGSFLKALAFIKKHKNWSFMPLEAMRE